MAPTVVKNLLSDSNSIMGKSRFFPLLLLSDVLVIKWWKLELGWEKVSESH